MVQLEQAPAAEATGAATCHALPPPPPPPPPGRPPKLCVLCRSWPQDDGQ